MEADQCYYLVNEPHVRHKDEIDLATDPPPDLVVEIEVSRSIVDRLEVLAALGVPEIWCYDGTTLRVLQLTSQGEYQAADASQFISDLPICEVEVWLARRGEMDETSLVVLFQTWVREWILRAMPD